MTNKRLQGLARQHGTPVVIIDHDVIRDNYAAFKKHLPKVQAYFAVKANAELRNNLGAAAHLIHGSSEGRFNITYCPGHLTQEEIESVNFRYADLKQMMGRYNPDRLEDGWNVMPDGEKIFYISNPALGLWAYRGRFQS